MVIRLGVEQTDELVRFERRFQIWLYTVGHRQLLIRSTKSAEWPSRVDVLFKDVRGMAIVPQIDSIRLERLGIDDAVSAAASLGITDIDEANVYLLAREPRLFVVAGVVVWHEDAGEYYDPSHFDTTPPPGLRRLG